MARTLNIVPAVTAKTLGDMFLTLVNSTIIVLELDCPKRRTLFGREIEMHVRLIEKNSLITFVTN